MGSGRLFLVVILIIMIVGIVSSSNYGVEIGSIEKDKGFGVVIRKEIFGNITNLFNVTQVVFQGNLTNLSEMQDTTIDDTTTSDGSILIWDAALKTWKTIIQQFMWVINEDDDNLISKNSTTFEINNTKLRIDRNESIHNHLVINNYLNYTETVNNETDVIWHF